jgi:acetyl-CoA acetyltransferase
MTSQFTGPYTGWERNKEGLGAWPDQGKVAIMGWGMSSVDRRWDGVSMDRTLGAYCILAAQRAMEDAGITPDQIDGLFTCPDNMAGAGTGGSAGSWGPMRPYFEPPYDSEEGLTIVTQRWMLNNMGLPNVKFAPEYVPAIGAGLGMAAQAVADGKCTVALYIYTANNLEGRYRRGGEAASDEASGALQWTNPWGANTIDIQMGGTIAIQQYCQKYGTTWEELMAPLIINEHRNGLMNSWGFYSTNGPSGLTLEDYLNSRPIASPARIWDYDRPVNAGAAFIITTAERARDMRQKPVYVLNHNQGSGGSARSSSMTLDDWMDGKARVARMVYEGSGFHPEDVDIFNPYDGFSPFLPLALEAFQWHGVKEGDAKDFVKGDISVEGPHPFVSGGGNLGNGRTRTAMYIDGIEQLRGTAGNRQVTVKAETAICAYAPGLSANYLCLSNSLP